jgi:ceramide glucosyltransferase
MREVVAAVVGLGLAYYLATLVAATFKLFLTRRNNSVEDDSFLPPISILKPVNGVEGNLYQNLLSFVNQNYPDYEIIIGVQSRTDSAIELVKKIQRDFPDKKIKCVVSDRVLGYNPKVSNLYGMFPVAENDFMVISDSNVLVDADYLKENVKYFRDGRVGLVTNLIRGIGGQSLGSVFENLHLNSFVIGNVSLLDIAEIEIVVGKSIFFRKSQFDSLGGIWELRNYLAEDYLMGMMYKNSGYRIVVSPQTVITTNHSWDFNRFLNRHTRWAQLRWNLNKPAYIGELLVNFPLWSLVFAAISGFSYEASLLTAFCWGAKISGDALMNAALSTGLGIGQCLAAPLKDLVIAFTWPIPLINRKTKWRGNPVRITHKTLLLPTND